jgi:hypothetical protein
MAFREGSCGRDAGADHHVEIVGDQAVDQLSRRRGIIGHIAVDQHIDLGVHIGEHAAHDIAFALVRRGAHDRAGRARLAAGAVA